MSVVQTLIGNIKGPQGETGATGATGAAGAAATVNVGTVSTTAYGNPAQVTNSGTESAAVLDFVIPQGAPGEEVTDLSNLSIGSITTQTAQYPTPQIGDTGATLVGKIIKYFSDLRTLIATKLDAANVVNNKTTTESGYALDARQANPNVSGTLAAQISALNATLTALIPTTLPSTITDVHDIATNSIYFVQGSVPANYPVSGTYQSFIWTLYHSNALRYQIVVQHYSTFANIYTCRYINGTWDAWRKYTSTAV